MNKSISSEKVTEIINKAKMLISNFKDEYENRDVNIPKVRWEYMYEIMNAIQNSMVNGDYKKIVELINYLVVVHEVFSVNTMAERNEEVYVYFEKVLEMYNDELDKHRSLLDKKYIMQLYDELELFKRLIKTKEKSQVLIKISEYKQFSYLLYKILKFMYEN